VSPDVFRTLRQIAPQRIWDGVSCRAVYGEQMTLATVELAPNSVIPEHSHANEQLGLLVEGSVTFRVGEETQALAPGATWCIAGHVPHEIRVGSDGAVVIEAFSPRRDDWKALDQLEQSAPRWPT
jgi:quercetin dioxygenase-like cupin family protein